MNVADQQVPAERIRLLVFGDELVAGVGDPRSQGWVDRVLTRTLTQIPVEPYIVSYPQLTISQLQERLERDLESRLAPPNSVISKQTVVENKIVLALGHADAASGMSAVRARLALANTLDNIKGTTSTVFVVGPPPTLDAEFNKKLSQFNAVYAESCQRRDVYYVDTFNPLLTREDWQIDLLQTTQQYGMTAPGQTGYGLMAWLVLHGGWSRWLGIPEV